MGGGWGKRGSGVPLAQRVRGDQPPACTTTAGPARAGLPGPALLGGRRGRRRGREAARAAARVAPGRGRWEGRVTYVARLRPLEANGGWLVVEEWLPAELLTPL